MLEKTDRAQNEKNGFFLVLICFVEGGKTVDDHDDNKDKTDDNGDHGDDNGGDDDAEAMRVCRGYCQSWRVSLHRHLLPPHPDHSLMR